MKVEMLSGTDTLRRRSELAGLLGEVIVRGAALGFTPPVTAEELESYWREVAGEVASGRRQHFVAIDPRGKVAGSAQLVLAGPGVGPGRAVVQKLIVRHALRGRGIGSALMTRVEVEARAVGRAALLIDAGAGSGGAPAFCRRLGFTFAGGAGPGSTAPAGLPVSGVLFAKNLAPAIGAGYAAAAVAG